MVWDLRGALLKKQEVESARLAEFEFRHRARTFRLLAAELGADPDALARRAALGTDSEVLDNIAERRGLDHAALDERYRACRAEARAMLIGEFGDPAPLRLA